MKSNSYSSNPIAPVPFSTLANVAESSASLTPGQNVEQITEQVVFEVEFVKIFNDRVIGKIWFLGTSSQEDVKQGEGVVIIPLSPDAVEREFTLRGHEASIVANTYNEFGDVVAVVQGIVAIERLSTDDTKIKTGFGQIKVYRISERFSTLSSIEFLDR